MASRFKTAPVPSGEVARYTSDPYNLSSIYMFGSSSPFTGTGNTIVRPNDDLLISKGGNRALVVYQRLLYDEQVQACFRKLLQEVTSRPWFIQEYSDKPGDLAVRDFVAEVLEEMDIDALYTGMAEAIIAGFSVGEIMWKKTKRGGYSFRRSHARSTALRVPRARGRERGIHNALPHLQPHVRRCVVASTKVYCLSVLCFPSR